MTGLIIILGAIGLWFFLGLKILKPDEMALKVFFGKLGEFCDSGLHWVPFLPKCYLAKRPRTLFNLDYSAREVITKEDDYQDIHYGSQVIKVDAVAYIKFPPKKKHLTDIIRSKVPTEIVALTDWTEEAVLSALRVVFGQMTWKQAVETMDNVRKEADKIFKEHNALIVAGFDSENLRLAVKEIKLSKGLEQFLSKPDQERLAEQAAIFVARRQSTEWVGMVLESMAQSRGKTVEEIQKEIDGDPKKQKEFLDYAKEINIRLEEADRGALTDIRVSGAEGIERSLLNLVALLKKEESKTKQNSSSETSEDPLGPYNEWLEKRRKNK